MYKFKRNKAIYKVNRKRIVDRSAREEYIHAKINMPKVVGIFLLP